MKLSEPTKVAYLFGAGASANALPVVNQIPKYITDIRNGLAPSALKLSNKDKFGQYVSHLPENRLWYQEELIKDLKWLETASSRHASVDTFAKKLFLTKDRVTLRRLKSTLSAFFVLVQASRRPDIRYDAFYASIINSLNSLPDNIRILSWNYDNQFEIAYAEYSRTSNIEHQAAALNIRHLLQSSRVLNSFGIIKLNGSAALLDDVKRVYPFSNKIHKSLNIELVEDVVMNFAVSKHISNAVSGLSFAWETHNKDWGEDHHLEPAINHVKDCEDLVVIGYSFPFFNREIDRRIIGGMQDLKNVYFQDLEPQNLRERFKSIRDDIPEANLNLRYDLDQFVLPNSL